MTTSQPRQPKGQPVGGQFAGKQQSGDEVVALNRGVGEVVPFQWDRSYRNVDQVAPYEEAFLALRAQIVESGGYPYNDLFKNRIPGIEGDDEDSAIYLLQQRFRLQEKEEELARWRGQGAIDVDFGQLEFGEQMRGDLVVHGFYSGGSGVKVYRDVRVEGVSENMSFVLPKGHSTNGFYVHHEGEGVLFKPAPGSEDIARRVEKKE